jgi:hypothetical protein
MAQIKIDIELPDDFEGDATPTFMHDLVKYQLQEFEMNGDIKSFEWELIE